MRINLSGLLAVCLCLVPVTVLADADPEAGKLKSAICMGCHGVEGEGMEATAGGQAFPSLAGQVPGYFTKSVLDFKNDIRIDALMGAIAKGLSDEDIANLAAFYAALK